jgi:lysophospholipase L1-like esterase
VTRPSLSIDDARSRPRWLRLLGRVIPGVEDVQRQTGPYSTAWQADNARALAEAGPLWVALGDSITQGIGAASHLGGWVGQLHQRLSIAGMDLRVVNLSVTGAHIADILRDQIPALDALGQLPQVVTLLAGANDMNHPKDRLAAPAAFRELLKGLPVNTPAVVATLPNRNQAAEAINQELDEAARERRLCLADTRAFSLRDVPGTLAKDFFHPNERGYKRLADVFEPGVRAALTDRLHP